MPHASYLHNKEERGSAMWHTYFNKIGLVCVLGLAACGAEKSEDPAAETAETTIDESVAKGFDLQLIGTFISDSRQPGDLTQLVLKTNNTFHSSTLVVCVAPPCDPIQQD